MHSRVTAAASSRADVCDFFRAWRGDDWNGFRVLCLPVITTLASPGHGSWAVLSHRGDETPEMPYNATTFRSTGWGKGAQRRWLNSGVEELPIVTSSGKQ